jgi:lipopolysaccharide export system permease protein
MTIYWYILKEYFKYVIGTIVLTVFMFVLFDFIHRTSKDFFKAAETIDIVRFYLYQVPGWVVQALPIAALLASVISMILLSRTNEITAMRAAGMGPFRIGTPLAMGGLVLSILSFAIGELVVPRFAQNVHYIQQVKFEGEKDEGLADGARWTRDGQTLVNFADYDPITQTLTRVRLIDVRPNFRASRTIESDIAVYVPDKKSWTLTNARILSFKRTGTLEAIEEVGDIAIPLPLEPKKLKKDRRKPGELSYRELGEIVARGEKSGVDVLPYKIDYHGKFAYPFAALVVSLIGLKFGYKSERATETAKGVLLAFIIGISYWIVLSSARAVGLRGGLHPFIAAWIANVVILGFVVIDGWRSRRA